MLAVNTHKCVNFPLLITHCILECIDKLVLHSELTIFANSFHKVFYQVFPNLSLALAGLWGYWGESALCTGPVFNALFWTHSRAFKNTTPLHISHPSLLWPHTRVSYFIFRAFSELLERGGAYVNLIIFQWLCCRLTYCTKKENICIPHMQLLISLESYKHMRTHI